MVFLPRIRLLRFSKLYVSNCTSGIAVRWFIRRLASSTIRTMRICANSSLQDNAFLRLAGSREWIFGTRRSSHISQCDTSSCVTILMCYQLLLIRCCRITKSRWRKKLERENGMFSQFYVGLVQPDVGKNGTIWGRDYIGHFSFF